MAQGKQEQRLSPSSTYETLFGTRHRRAGRPAGGAEVMFPAEGLDPVIARAAERRAFAVVHHEQRDRLSELFHKEARVLNARGAEQVASDMGLTSGTGTKRGEAHA